MKELLLNKANYLKINEKILLEEAIEYAEKAHLGQKRATGEPYIIHPIAVCEILIEYNADITTLVSALLHDVVEDTGISILEIEKSFGTDVAFIVEGLTKVDKSGFDKEEYSAINFEKLLSTSAIDIRIAIVKIADRLHNVRTLSVKKVEKKVPYANETLIIFSQLADKLGLFKIQEELENIAFSYLNPPKYEGVSKLIDNFTKIFIDIFNLASNRLKKRNRNDIPIEMNWLRVPIYKSYSMLQEGRPLSELYRIEVITDLTLNCYMVLGLIHESFHPIPHQFLDNIAIKKGPFSEYLSTKVLIEEIEVEFQIKTQSCKKLTDKGIFNFLNKNISSKEIEVLSNEILKGSINAVKSISKNPIEFYDLITFELLQMEITVFTPKMDPIILPEGSTAIDFAFHLNSNLAKKMSYIKVNGEIKPINTVLYNMDIIEIIILDKETVKIEWLNYAQTSKAISEIKMLGPYE